jgi:hypothetical protein
MESQWRTTMYNKSHTENNDTKDTKETKENIVEGFDIFGNDYFINVKRGFQVKGKFREYIDKLKEKIKKIPNPIRVLDKGIEKIIQGLLLATMSRIECKTGKVSAPRSKELVGGFTWSKIIDASQSTQKKVEGFSIQSQPDLITTIESFMTNHPKIINKTALVNYYITSLNAFEKSINAPPTSEQLFVFNNEFDNSLADSAILKQLNLIAAALPKSSYKNTVEGYKSFLKKTARFSFTSSRNINYYLFNTDYFPRPEDIAGFETTIKLNQDSDYIHHINVFLSNMVPANPPPTPTEDLNDIDLNYAFSTNFNSPHSASIKSYLVYVTQWFSFIVFNKQREKVITYPTIESIVCSIYLDYLNALEFQKYRIYSTFLTPYELAMFNHLFFICLHQDDIESNVYNAVIPSDGAINFKMLKAEPNLYINLLPQSIFQMLSTIAVEINLRIPHLTDTISTGSYQPLPLDGAIIIPLLPTDEPVPPLTIFLCDYILNDYDPISYKKTKIPSRINPSTDIKKYFIPEGLSKCEKENLSKHQESKYYANIIKKELYQLFTIPIIVYMVYNIFYLFFFKDCYSVTYTTDENGKNTYKHRCEGGEKGGCFTPIFPDWETMFHNVELHNTDFILEFIFKPAKMYYTIINSVKAIFRKEIGGVVLKDKFPYLFLLLTYRYVNKFIEKNGGKIVKTIETLLYFKIPDFKFGKDPKAFYSYAKTITMFFFGISFLKNFFGVDPMKQLEEFMKRKEEDQGGQGDEENEDMEEGFMGGDDGQPVKKSSFSKAAAAVGNAASSLMAKADNWKDWIMNSPTTFVTIIKIIVAIIYWILKLVIAIKFVNVSILVCILYLLWNLIFGMSTFTTPIQSVGSKIDLIHRVIYTPLCNNEKDGIFTYFAKSIIFFSIYFMVEFIIIQKFQKGMKSFGKMKNPMTASLGDEENKNNFAVKSFMIILYGLMICIVLLWCFYKFLIKMPDVVRAYKPQKDDTKDKRFEFNCEIKDAYEDQSKNSFIKTLFLSDLLNKTHIDEFNKKTEGIRKPSMIAGFINKIGELKKNAEQGVMMAYEKAKSLKRSAGDTFSSFKSNFSRNSQDNES